VRSGSVERLDVAGLGGDATGVGRHGVEERADKRGPCISEGERESTENGRRESKKKTSFAKYVKGMRGPSG
jgi:hypothetical protein